MIGTTDSIETTCILESPIYREDWENEPYNIEDPGKTMPGDTCEMDQTLPITLLQISVAAWSGLKLNSFETVYGRSFQVSVSRNTPFWYRTQIKNQAICTTFKANTNNFAKVCSLQIYLPIWWVLIPVLSGRSNLTEDLEDSRSWRAVSQAMVQSLWCPVDNTLFPKVQGNEALDPPHMECSAVPSSSHRICHLPQTAILLPHVKASLHSWPASSFSR